jgi:urease accessory protein
MMMDSNLPLLIWLSPNFPIGSFAYSHGLEWAVDSGDIQTPKELLEWIVTLLEHGAVRNDAIILKLAWEAARAENFDHLDALNALALALSASRERYLEISAQGNAFLSAVASAWPCEILERFIERLEGDTAYPVGLGIAAAGHMIALAPLLRAFNLNFCNLLISSALRLGIIGQIEAQKILAACCLGIEKLVDFASSASLEALGACALHCDLASLYHETQYSRLFRS